MLLMPRWCLCPGKYGSEKLSKREFFVPTRTMCDVLFRYCGGKIDVLFLPEKPEMSPGRHWIGEKRGGTRTKKMVLARFHIFL